MTYGYNLRHRYDKYFYIKTCFGDRLRVFCVPKYLVEDTMFCSGDGLESRLIAKDLLHKIKLSLSERDYKVLHLYYAGKYTMKEIGRMLGVTEARISQIHSKMIQGIREKWSL